MSEKEEPKNEEMQKEEKREEEEKGGVPEWAQNLQETLNDLPNKLKEALTPEQKETGNEATPIPVPQAIPQDDPQPQEVQQDDPRPRPEEQEQKPKKKKGFLDWLL